MARSQLTSLVVSFLVLSLAVSSITANQNAKSVDVVVEGVVYCQSCDHSGTWSLTGAEPIEEATVSIICKDHRNRVSFYKAFQTDKNGYFYAQLVGFKMNHYLLDHPLHSCHVKLVSSPLKTCNLLSNINYGLYGASLRYEDKKLVGKDYEAVIYAAGPLAFRPAHCGPKATPED